MSLAPSTCSPDSFEGPSFVRLFSKLTLTWAQKVMSFYFPREVNHFSLILALPPVLFLCPYFPKFSVLNWPVTH